MPIFVRIPELIIHFRFRRWCHVLHLFLDFLIDLLEFGLVAVIFGNEEFHALNHVVHIALFGKRDDIGNVVEHIVEIVGTHLGNHNLIVAGHIFNSVLLVGEEFLVEFSPGRSPISLIWISTLGRSPASEIMRVAKS